MNFINAPETKGHYIQPYLPIEEVPSRILTMGGRAEVHGLKQDRGNPGEYADIPMTLEWLPVGDYGRVRVAPAGLEYFWVSGFSYAHSGIKLSHYYSRWLD